jgi:hypothetical protein
MADALFGEPRLAAIYDLVEGERRDLTGVSGELVSYRRTYVFGADGVALTSDSTRRFRSRAEIEDSLRSTGYVLAGVRDAPDRPGREWVFIARKPG